MVIAQTQEWKEENGEYSFLSSSEGTIHGEAMSPWEKLDLNEEGLLSLMGGMILFEKELDHGHGRGGEAAGTFRCLPHRFIRQPQIKSGVRRKDHYGKQKETDTPSFQ